MAGGPLVCKPSRRWPRVIFSVLSALLTATLFLAAITFLPATVHYHITERYTFEAPEDSQVALSVLAPVSGPYQWVGPVRATWEGQQELRDAGALTVVELRGAIAAGRPATAVIDYEVRLPQGPATWAGPVRAADLEPQTDIESDAPAIQAQAAQLGRGAARADAYGIFRFVAGYLSWPTGTRMGGGQSALQAYESRIGGCGEFANLTVAMLRARGIPARSISGLAFINLAVLPPYWPAQTYIWGHPAAAHAWVELYADGRWEMADPSWASRGIPSFGRNDGSHLSFGEAGAEQALYQQIHEGAQANGHIAGGMSAPLKFVASASGEGVRVTPSASVRKGWDGRWAWGLAALAVSALVVRALQAWLRRAGRL